MGTLVKVAAYECPWQAHIAQGLLEAHGIKSFVFNDGVIHANPLLSNAVGGVKLMVDRSNADEALALLSRTGIEGAPESRG